MSSEKSNSKCRTSWYQSSVVIRRLHFTMAVWYLSSISKGSLHSLSVSFELSHNITRGGGIFSAEMTSFPAGRGYSFNNVSKSLVIQGSNAPSILFEWFGYQRQHGKCPKRHNGNAYPSRSCSSPSPLLHISEPPRLSILLESNLLGQQNFS